MTEGIKRKVRSEYIILTLLVVMAVSMRLYSSPSYPYHEDEAGSFIVMESIAKTGLPLTEDGSIYWRSLLGHYLMAIPLFFLEGSPYSYRLVSIVMSGLLLYILFAMGRAAEGRLAGWLAPLFMVFSAYESMFAINARFYVPFQFFFTAAVFFSGDYFIHGGRRSGLLLLLSTLAAIGTHHLSLELFPVFAAAVFLGRKWSQLLSSRFLAGCLIAAAFVYLNLFYIPQGGYVSRFAFPLIIGGMENKWGFYEVFRRAVPFGVTLLMLALVPVSEKGNQVLRFYFISFALLMVLLSLAAPLESERYMSNLLPLGVVVASSSASWWGRKILGLFRGPRSLAFSLSFFGKLLVIAASVAYLATLENRDAGHSFGHQKRYRDQKPAHDYIKKRLSTGDYVISLEPGLTSIYLGRSPDFFLRERYDSDLRRYVPYSEEGKKGFSAQLIDSPERLQVLLQERRRVWLYANVKLFFTTSMEMQDIIGKYFIPVFERNGTYVLLFSP